MDIMSTTNISIVINNRDRLTTTKKMVEHILSLNPNQKIIIIDNGSTYPPLLKWYDEIGWYDEILYNVKVERRENKGHLAFWHYGFPKWIGEYFVYTDSDIILNAEMPKTWLEEMFDILQSNNVKKVSLALEIDDLPEIYTYKNQVVRNEGRWWLNKIQYKDYELYKADTDTTFSLMRNFHDNCYESIRVAGKFTAKHAPWYIDINNLDEEEKYYLNNIDLRFNTQYSKQHLNPQQFTDR